MGWGRLVSRLALTVANHSWAIGIVRCRHYFVRR